MNIHFIARSPRYIWNRFRTRYFFRLHPELPWLTRDSIELLSTLLKSDDVGIEWGQGRSTSWFAGRVKYLISVEHDVTWFNRVTENLAGTANVDLRLREVPSAYVGVADELRPESLDFALVDGGLARDECAHRVIPLLKPGGVLILDNANWYLPTNSNAPGSRRLGDQSRFDAASWDDFLIKVASWRHIWTTDGVTCTALWFKPCKKVESEK